jgi:ABC-type spermidine/putrescine transport system permease subunit I
VDGRVSEAEGGRVASEPAARSSRRRRRSRGDGVWYPKWFWPAFVAPAAIVLLILFVLPFYAVVGVAFGRLDPIFRTPIPVWNPLQWDRVSFTYVASNLVGSGGIYRESVIRTLFFVGIATVLCLLIGYPFAYFLARHSGKWRPVFLVAFFAPFLVSYMMRMTAWVNLLQDDGYLNQVLHWLGIMRNPYPWLSGKSLTVILGLVYGYVPLMILPLYATLDRIPQSQLEASRDLGASPASTFFRVTLPASKQAILAGTILAGLSMFGDYFTNQLLAGTIGTQMVGNWIVDSLADPLLVPRGAVLSLLLTAMLIPPIIYYLRSTRGAVRDVTM